mgnify:FL=1
MLFLETTVILFERELWLSDDFGKFLLIAGGPTALLPAVPVLHAVVVPTDESRREEADPCLATAKLIFSFAA